ncbi:DUF4214 domain-containing protein [Iodobacter sp. CM08]|uniref:DUF4214 domain-containing protein n=1 Tax=Iodobacter sp. CM08 TaxID=3085902 RepID=UPI0029824892|nr:DUF4214 domain-containing protein [Iodobacter sp. CM08]MDW5415611.1 DUF4214 domain-containing protein [Iodobacter sp. CM08]
MATAAALAFVQKLYVAYYQRPADYAGQQYWAEKFDKDGGASAIASAFATSTESVALYGSQSLGAQINAVYQAAFGRAAETAGLQFYLNEISAGRLTVGTMAVSVLNGAAGTDLTTLTSKLAVAAAYSTAVSDASGILKYVGDASAVAARAFLATVTTANQATSTTAVTAQVTALVAPSTITTFTLTEGIDTFVGGAGGDSFVSTKVGGFGPLDSLDGGAGTDTLSVSDTAAISTSTSQVVKNIETVSLVSSLGVTADVSGWTGLTKLTVQGVGNMTVTGATTTMAILSNSGANTTTVVGTGGDLAITAGTGAVTVGGTSVANNLTSVSVTNGAAVAITDRSGTAAATGSTMKTVSVTGATGASTITGDGVTTLNLSSLTAATTVNNVTLTAAAATRNLTLNLNGLDTANDGAATAGTTVITDAEATSLTINAMTSKSFDVTATTAKVTSVAVKADVDLHMDALGSAVATKLDVSGAGKFTADTLTLTTAGVITSTSTGGVLLTTALGTGQQFVGTASSGADSISLGASTLAQTTGGGNDTVTATQFGTGGSVDAGAGTDYLIMASADIVANTVTTATKAASFTNFETLVASDAIAASIDVTKLVGVTAVTAIAGVNTSTLTLNTANTVGLGADSAGAIGFTVGGTSATDTLTLNMNGWNSAGAATFTGVETLNINTGSNTALAFSATAPTIAPVSATAAVFATTLTMTPSAGAAGGVINVSGTSDMTFTGVVTAAKIDASALTGILTVTAAAANAITITGGSKADVINGSAAADLLTGGEGADVITGAAGNDSIVLTETTAAIDKVVFSGGATNAATLTANGMDTITGFGATDTINVAGLGNQAMAALTGTLSAAAAQSVIADGSTYIINTAATAAALTTGGTATVTDFTNMTQVAAFLSERFSHTTTTADIEAVFVWNVGTTTYIYNVDTLNTANTTIDAAEVSLVGTITQGAALATANIVFA